VCRVAAHYGGWPHEVAQFPVPYFLVLRDDYLRSQGATKPQSKDDDKPFTVELVEA